MHKKQLSSRLISSVWYDGQSMILLVRRRERGWRAFSGVPLEVYEEFASAESSGQHYMDHIHDRYRELKIWPDLVTIEIVTWLTAFREWSFSKMGQIRRLATGR